MSAETYDAFVEKWLAAEPWHRLQLVFEPTRQREARRLLESIGHELRATALDSSDARVVATKLGWWVQEWQGLTEGRPRHPLTVALAALPAGAIDADAGQDWIAAAASLAESDSDIDLSARRLRWQRYAQAQALAGNAWLDPAHAAHRLHADALMVERVLHFKADLARGRLPVPLSVLAAADVTRAQLAAGETAAQRALLRYLDDLQGLLDEAMPGETSRYRRTQAALARLRLDQLRRAPASVWHGVRPLPGWRSALAAWRVSRAP